ncbi:MAG: hypothetical protein F4Z97_08065 [Gammaproteobacteria bacterium]|nr:hypothetical protein [Gammaproteobacteria bacterium]
MPEVPPIVIAIARDGATRIRADPAFILLVELISKSAPINVILLWLDVIVTLLPIVRVPVPLLLDDWGESASNMKLSEILVAEIEALMLRCRPA